MKCKFRMCRYGSFMMPSHPCKKECQHQISVEDDDNVVKDVKAYKEMFDKPDAEFNKKITDIGNDLHKALHGDPIGDLIRLDRTLTAFSVGDIPGVKLEDDGNGGVKIMLEMTVEDLKNQQAMLLIPPDIIDTFHVAKESGKHVAIIGLGLSGKAEILLGEIINRNESHVEQMVIFLNNTPTETLAELMLPFGYTVEIAQPHRYTSGKILSDKIDFVAPVVDFSEKPQKSKYARGNRKYDKKKFF